VKAQAGFSLVEVLVAALLIGVALVPLMQMFPGLLEEDQTDEVTMQLGAVAVRQTESLVNTLRGNITGAASGSAACPDLPGCRLVWTITTEAASATPGVGRLVDLSVIACVDTDGNGLCDPGETQVRQDAKVTSRP
jgi:prepilin-type N-terminal cleavage/methylation domain-containing protein